MGKYIIDWNSGYGPSYAVVEAETEDDAQRMAYEQWREEAENNADYGAQPYTEDLAELCEVNG